MSEGFGTSQVGVCFGGFIGKDTRYSCYSHPPKWCNVSTNWDMKPALFWPTVAQGQLKANQFWGLNPTAPCGSRSKWVTRRGAPGPCFHRATSDTGPLVGGFENSCVVQRNRYESKRIRVLDYFCLPHPISFWVVKWYRYLHGEPAHFSCFYALIVLVNPPTFFGYVLFDGPNRSLIFLLNSAWISSLNPRFLSSWLNAQLVLVSFRSLVLKNPKFHGSNSHCSW